MRAVIKLTCALALTLLWAVTPALADVPTEMSVQGRLTNGAGAPVPAGFKNFTFKIFDAPVGGSEIWPGGPGETQLLATDANGLWNAGVGELIPLTEAVFQSPVRWLEVTVNDGVNPIETLPRIELRTNPYTYRAATSQQADSLAGNSLADIADMFVDEAGDTMTGSLSWTNGSYAMNYIYESGVGNPERAVIQHSSAWPGWGLYYDDIPDNWHFKMGGINIVSIEGLGLTIQGGANPTTINSYFPGDGSVMLPSDAVSSAEMLDEAGISNSVNPFFFFAGGPGTVYTVDSVEITTPSSGYVEVEAQLGWINMAHTAGTSTEVWCGVSTIAGDGSLDDGAQVIRIPFDHVTTSTWAIPLGASRIFAEGAGPHKYYVNVYYSSGASGSINFGRPYIRARFFPTLYGTVSFSASSLTQSTADESDRIEAMRPGAAAVRDITVEGHNAVLEAQLSELRARLDAIEAEARSMGIAAQSGRP